MTLTVLGTLADRFLTDQSDQVNILTPPSPLPQIDQVKIFQASI